MRLINTKTLDLEEQYGDQISKYAILSHTWGDHEASYQDWQDVRKRSKQDFQKIHSACKLAAQHSLQYLWVDTNCINKESSAELTEAINSMYMWYRNSTVCFAYIDDYTHHDSGQTLDQLANARWFTRGWTLQELLAPDEIKFFDVSWKCFGTKKTLLRRLSKITSIHHQYLMSPSSISQASISRRMSWISQRSTKREEDMAYCLLGLFEINMPLLYGEGPKAFIRLQEEIIKYSNDHTIFCWDRDSLDNDRANSRWFGCLCPDPTLFRDAGDIVETMNNASIAPDYQLTNGGLRISLCLLDCFNSKGCKLAVLNARSCRSPASSRLSLVLQKTTRNGSFARSSINRRLMQVPTRDAPGDVSTIYIVHEREPRRVLSDIRFEHFTRTYQDPRSGAQYAIMPVTSTHASGSVVVSEGATKAFDQHPDVILQMANDKTHWTAGRKIKLPDRSELTISFNVQIKGPGAEEWAVTVTLRGTGIGPLEDLLTTQQYVAPKWSEFRSTSTSGTYQARPVFVSFEDYLHLMKDRQSQAAREQI